MAASNTGTIVAAVAAVASVSVIGYFVWKSSRESSSAAALERLAQRTPDEKLGGAVGTIVRWAGNFFD